MIRATSAALAAALALAVVGCDDPTGPSGFEFLVQVRAVSEPVAPSEQSAPARAEGVESIDVEEAVIALAGLTLDGSENTNTPDWTLDQTVVVPLRLAGEPTLAFAPAADEGEYKGLRIAIDELEPDKPQEATLIDVFPRLEGLSILVWGTVVRDGIPEEFLFRTAANTVEELQFARPRRFTSESAAIAVFTVRFNLDAWFETPGGILLDPNDPADKEAIDASLLESMEIVTGSGA